MTAPVALNAAFMHMGFSAEAAAILADVDQENLTVGALQYLDDKGFKTLCAWLCKPEGMIDGPAPAGGGTVPQIPTPGVYVSTRAEGNMALICYMAQHYVRFSQTLEAAVLSVPNMYLFEQYKEAKDAYKEPTEVMKLKTPDKINDFIDD
jgi:hypothetical protein